MRVAHGNRFFGHERQPRRKILSYPCRFVFIWQRVDDADEESESDPMSQPTPSAPLPGVSVLMPCYNERRGVSDVLDQVERAFADADFAHEIIVIDDGSTDRTVECVDTDRFRLVCHDVNRGYGAALKTGARAARYDRLVLIDADGTYPAEAIGELVAALDEVEMAVGARTGVERHIPPLRLPAKWVLRRLARYLTGRRIPDLNSGLRAIRRDLWMRYEAYYPDGFSLTTTITLAALTNRHRVRYIEIDYRARVGHSKIRPVRDTLNFLQLILRTVLYFDPMKIFLPTALALFAASMLVGVGTLTLANVFGVGRFMDVTTALLFVTGLQTLALGALADLVVRRLR